MINELFSSMHELLDYIIEHYDTADDEQREQFCEAIQQIKDNNDLLMDHYVSLEEKLVHFFELYRAVQAQAAGEADAANAEINAEVEAGLKSMSAAVKTLHARSGAMYYAAEDEAKQQPAHFPGSLLALYNCAEAASCNECDLFISPEHEMALDQAQGYYKLFMFAESAHILQAIIAEQPECNIARIYYGMSLMHLRNWNEAQRQFQLLTVLSDFPKWLALSFNALGCIQAIKLNLNQAELLFKKAYQLYPKFEDPLKNLQSCMESPQQLSLYFGSTELCCT